MCDSAVLCCVVLCCACVWQACLKGLMKQPALKDLCGRSVLDMWRETITKDAGVANVLEGLAAADPAAALWMLRAKAYSHAVSLRPDIKAAQVGACEARSGILMPHTSGAQAVTGWSCWTAPCCRVCAADERANPGAACLAPAVLEVVPPGSDATCCVLHTGPPSCLPAGVHQGEHRLPGLPVAEAG